MTEKVDENRYLSHYCSILILGFDLKFIERAKCVVCNIISKTATKTLFYQIRRFHDMTGSVYEKYASQKFFIPCLIVDY